MAPAATPATIADVSGKGDKVVKVSAQESPLVARITNKGQSNFSVTSYIGSMYDDLLVNEIGGYAGSVWVNPGVTRLKVNSSGRWTIVLKPISAVRQWDGSAAISGKGDQVVMLSGGSSGTTTIKNKGHDNFSVIAYGPDGEYLDLLVNEIGSYNGEVLLPDNDPIVLSIGAVGGTWSFSAVSQ